MGTKFLSRAILTIALVSWIALVFVIRREVLVFNSEAERHRQEVSKEAERTTTTTRRPRKDKILQLVPPKEPGVSYVLIVSPNPRSGTSFLSEILTPNGTDSLYIFEPLRWLEERPPPNTTPRDQARSRGSRRRPEVRRPPTFRPMPNATSEAQLLMLGDFYSCHYGPHWDLALSDRARKNVFRKPVRGFGAKSLNEQQIRLGFIMENAVKECKRTKNR